MPLFQRIFSSTPDDASAIGKFADDLLKAFHVDASSVPAMLLFVVALIVLKTTMSIFAYMYAGYFTARVATQLRLEILNVTIARNWQSFTSLPTGEVVNILIAETGRAAGIFLHYSKLLQSVFRTILMLSAALVISLYASLTVIVAGLIMWFLLGRFVRISTVASRMTKDTMRLFSKELADILTSIKPLKAMNKESLILEHVSSKNSYSGEIGEKADTFQICLIRVAGAVHRHRDLHCRLWRVSAFIAG